MIDNEVNRIANDYDYTEDVNAMVRKFKEEIIRDGSNKIIYLEPNFEKIVLGDTDETIANKMADKVIYYRTKEKAFVTLMAEGLIYPIGTCDGCYTIKITYKKPKGSTEGDFFLNRIVFNKFMTM